MQAAAPAPAHYASIIFRLAVFGALVILANYVTGIVTGGRFLQ